MNILHVFYELKFSGAEIMYADAGPKFKKLNFNLTAFNTSQSLGEFSSILSATGYRIIHFPIYENRFNLFQKIRFWTKCYKFLIKENIDIVHIHTTTLKWDMAFIAWLAGRKSVYTIHNVFPTNGIKLLYNKYLRYSARKMGCTFQSISDSIFKLEKELYNNETIRINNWYGDSRYFPAETWEKEKVRSELHINAATLVIISVGGCSHVKRHSHIIEALKIIIDTSNSDIIYLHLGEGLDVESEIAFANELGIAENIRFLGNQKDVRKYLIASDIYVMPSKHEGTPITTIEAMACNIPTILYDVPGLRDFNRDHEISRLVSENPQSLAAEIMSMSVDSEKQARLISGAQRFVTKNYSLDKNTTRIINELYNIK
jgi:glycosyltransferase involved in cell wall biosynthesis